MHIHELYLHHPTNRLFIGTFEKGIYVYDINTRKLIHPQVELTDASITRISPLNDKELLIATEGAGVHKLNIETYGTTPYIVANYGSYNEMDGNIINDVYVDNDHRIWLSNYPKGITIRNDRYTNYNWIKHSIGNRQSLINNQVHSIIEDSEGDLWFGTSNGISLYTIRNNQWHSFLSSFERGAGTQNRIFLTLCEVSPGIIWAGGYTSGIYQIDKRNSTIQYLTPSLSFHLDIRPDKYIRAIKKDRQGYIWTGGYYNLKCFDLKNRKGRLYPGLGSITSIEEKDSTHMWIGTSTNLYLLDKQSGEIENIELPGGATYIYTLYQTAEDLLYIGTSSAGLFVYDSRDRKIAGHYHTGNSTLVSNNIYTLLPGNDSHIVMSTENGISSFSPSGHLFRNWTRGQGLPSTSFNASSGILCSNGNVMFGSTDGTLEFPKEMKMPKSGTSRMIFSDLRIFYQTVYPNDKDSPLAKDIDQTKLLRLKYKQNTFSIKVSSINYDYPSDILYTWQLKGFYDGWSTPDDEGTIHFTNVPPGTYFLHVRSVSKENKQHILQERTLKIIVAQPVWLSFWALLLYVLTLSMIIYVAFRLYSMRREKKASDERTRFFINTAHDIRTPLTLIKAPLEEIQHKEALSEESLVNMRTALKNVDTLLRLTTNLINLGKTNVYASTLRMSENELASYMTEIYHTFFGYAETKQITLTYESNFQYLFVWFDKEKMDSIVKNLISNALKYTPEHGKVHLTVRNEKETWSFEIKDTGIGIPAKEQKKLFKLHFRGSNAINAKVSGSGIGLMLVWKLVRMHKGKISIDSVETKGTRVKVVFPKNNSNKQQFPAETTEKESIQTIPGTSSVTKYTYKDIRKQNSQTTCGILVVEDNDDLRDYLSHILSENYRIETATNGKEALMILPAFKPDLVLSDIMMPEMRGDELCIAIKNNIETSHIPVILLTALNDDQSIMDGLRTGADKYLAKPFNIGILKVSIENILTNRALLRSKYTEIELHNKEKEIDYPSTLDQEFLNAVKQVINANIANPDFNVEMLCTTQNMSRSSFYNKLKALTDQAPADYIRLIRLKRAAQLLAEGEHNISEVADMTGFNDAKYFREVFKKYFKVSPSRYSKGETGKEPSKT